MSSDLPRLPEHRQPVMLQQGPRVRWDLLLLAIFAGLVTGVVTYAMKAPVGRAIGVGAVVAASAIVLLVITDRRSSRESSEMPPIPPLHPSAARWQIPGYYALRYRPRVLADRVRKRMRAVVEQSLAERGIGYDTPQARQLLGADVHRWLDEQDRDLGRAQAAELLAVVTRLSQELIDARLPGPGVRPTDNHTQGGTAR